MNEYFSTGSMTIAGPPRQRALQYKKSSQQSTINFFSKGGTQQAWTEETAKLAAKEFEVPEGTRIAYIWPDFFDRDLLILEARYQRKYSVADRTEEKHLSGTGVCTPCPSPDCNSNENITIQQWTTSKGSVHSSLDSKGSIFLCIPQYKCCKCDKTFYLHTSQVWNEYPAELKKRYENIFFKNVAEGEGREILVTQELCQKLLKPTILFEEEEREFKEEHERTKRRAIEHYKDFVEKEKREHKGDIEVFAALWPTFNEERFTSDHNYPRQKKIKKMFVKLYYLIEEYLEQDMFSRCVGEVGRLDASYKFLKKTRDDPEAEEEIQALTVIWGKWNHILTFAFAENEGDLVYQRLMWYLRKRCERLGGIAEVNKVKCWYSDTCCSGITDVRSHWITKIWPNVPRAPLKDLLHWCMGITRATEGEGHTLHELNCKLVKESAVTYDEARWKLVAEEYIKHSKLNLTIEVAKCEVLKKPEWKAKLKNLVPDGMIIGKKVFEGYQTVEIEDNRLHDEALREGRGYKRYLKQPIQDVRIGSKQAMLNAKWHAERGCLTDPFDVDVMNVPIDPDNPLSAMLKIRGTSQGECNNRETANLVHKISHQTAELAHMKLMLRGHQWNLGIDERRKKLLNIEEPRTVEWYLHQYLVGYSDTYNRMKFPPPYNKNTDWEPIGIHYGRCKDWLKIDAEIIALRATETRQSREPVSENLGDGNQSASIPNSDELPSNNEESNVAAEATINDVPLQQEQEIQQETPWNQAMGRRGDLYGPKEACYRSLGGRPTQPLPSNQFLPNTHVLTDTQRWHFWDIVERVEAVHRTSTAILTKEVANAWRSRHLRLFKTYDTGLGGLLRPSVVELILKQTGKKLFNKMILEGSVERSNDVEVDSLTPTAQDVALGVYRELIPTRQQAILKNYKHAAAQPKPPPAKKVKVAKKLTVYSNMNRVEVEKFTFDELRTICSGLPGVSYGACRKPQMVEKVVSFLEKQTQEYVRNFEHKPK